ncbi:MAG TPA: fibronectin type III domain-containing protein, partial [Candidatus Paceibacterota bacterium]|nr:fibronectin type III domain-containing protein [Candidatus Paceibacterota bacterium]
LSVKKVMSNSNRVSRGFAQLSHSALGTFGNGVVTGMTNNPAFKTPLVPVDVLSPAVTKFIAAQTKALNGGKIEISERDDAREELIRLLRQEAAYVEGVAGDDLTTLLSSGFEAVNTNRAQIPLPKPVIDRVENPGSAQLALRLTPVPTARAYEVRMSYGTNGWQAAGVFTQARKIVIENLTPGTTYTFQARAIGGSTGSSDWSDPVSHMSL